MPTPSTLTTLLQTLGVAITLAAPASAEDSYTLPSGHTVGPLDSFKECSVCPEMVVMPMGEFFFGAHPEESEALATLLRRTFTKYPKHIANEGPRHQVTMDLPFAIGRFEVTREEWLACVADRGCSHRYDPNVPSNFETHRLDDPRDPAFNMSYWDAQQYVRWLNRVVGRAVYRLPTEVEWEYAARAGTTTKFPQGDTITQAQANYLEWELVDGLYQPLPDQRNLPISVDALDAENQWGLSHVAGNVTEMTDSCYTETHRALSAQSEYLTIPAYSFDCDIVAKGGVYNGGPEFMRPAHRWRTRKERRRDYIGFRVLRGLE